MRPTVGLPVVRSPLEEWCQICGNRRLPQDLSYCGECGPTYEAYCEAEERRRRHWPVGILAGLSPRAVAVVGLVIGSAAVLLLAVIVLAV